MISTIHVLLVEDSPTDALLTEETLSVGCFRLQNSQRLEHAMGLVTANRFDVILLDLGLPDSQGLDTLRRLRSADPLVAIVVLTGKNDEDLALQALKEGAQDYLVKGQLQASSLHRVIRYAMERSATARLLRQSEERYRRVIEDQTEVVCRFTTDGTFTFVNDVYCRLFGKSQDELIGQRWQPVANPEDVVGIEARLSRMSVTNPLVVIENKVIDGTGRVLWMEFVNRGLYDLNGNLTEIQAVGRDIDGRRWAEDTLRSSEQRYRTLVAATSAIVWHTPASGEFEEEQPGWATFTGQSFEQYGGWGWLNAVHPEDRETTARVWKVAYTGRTVYLVEHRLRRASGEYRHMTVKAIPLLDPSGATREWVGLHVDVTDQKRAEELLHLRDRAIQAVKQGILITDPNQADNPIIYASPGFLQMTGYSAEEVVGRNCRFLQGVDTSAVTVARVREAVRDQRPCTEELLNYRKDGTSFWNELSLAPVTAEGSTVTHFVGVQTDVTERRRLEDQFRQSQKMDAIGQLAGGVAHDFNNLLTIINGYGNMISEEVPENSPVRQFAQEICYAGERAASLTRQLLAFSRKQVLEPKVLSLNTIVADTERMLRRLIGEDIAIVVVAAPALGQVKADPGQIEQVILNLAINARDAMPQGGRLTIETANTELSGTYTQAFPELKPGPYVMIAFTDTGTGMDEVTKARIFEPFFTTKEPGKGTGLGLATVFGIIKQSTGHVAVSSEVGLGTTFKIYLPRIHELDPASARISRQAADQGTETILLAEDEPALRALARHVLKLHGYTVLEAGSGEKSLRIAEEHPGTIHLLVTDVVMPGMSGRQLAERLAVVRPSMKVLYLSGYTDDAVVRHGVMQAETAFLQKPFTPVALAQKVWEVLHS